MFLISSLFLARLCSWRHHEVSWSVAVYAAGWSTAAAALAVKASNTSELVTMRRQELRHLGRKQHVRVTKSSVKVTFFSIAKDKLKLLCECDNNLNLFAFISIAKVRLKLLCECDHNLNLKVILAPARLL